jgi:hypothetical protein
MSWIGRATVLLPAALPVNIWTSRKSEVASFPDEKKASKGTAQKAVKQAPCCPTTESARRNRISVEPSFNNVGPFSCQYYPVIRKFGPYWGTNTSTRATCCSISGTMCSRPGVTLRSSTAAGTSRIEAASTIRPWECPCKAPR